VIHGQEEVVNTTKGEEDADPPFQGKAPQRGLEPFAVAIKRESGYSQDTGLSQLKGGCSNLMEGKGEACSWPSISKILIRQEVPSMRNQIFHLSAAPPPIPLVPFLASKLK